MNAKILKGAVRGSLGLAVAVASVLGTAPARAQQPATTQTTTGGLEEVVVTAQRREESLQAVPLAVSALSSDALEARGIRNLGELSAGKIPGFVPTRFSGGSTLAIAVRGVGLSDPTQGTVELTVPVYVDGVFLGRAQGLGVELLEPERIEVLRGPQGQLFGRNAEGGVVQYVTRKPTGEFGIRGSASFGNYDDQRVKVSVDLPAVAGLSTKFTGLVADHDPYTEMNSQSLYRPPAVVPGPPNYGHNLLDSSGGRFAARWQNDGSFTADYSYDYSDEFSSEGYLTWMDVDLVRPASALNDPTENLPDKTFERLYNHGFQVLTSGHNLTLAWDMSEAITLKSISAYRKVMRRGGNSLGTSLPAGGSSTGRIYTWAFEHIDQDQTSQELQFIGSWDQFDLTAGGLWFNEEVTDFRRSNVTGPGLSPPALGLQPATLGYCVTLQLDPCPTTNALQGAESDSWGVYAQGTYRPVWATGLELTLGLRYTDDQKDAQRTQNNSQPVDQRAEFSASRVDPAAVIQYRWTDDVQTYLRYATGYRAGGANVRSSNFTSFDEEENEAWELGLKSQWFDNRVQANVALFYNTIKGEQLTIQESPTTNPSLTNTFNNPEDKDVTGGEVELVWAATDALVVGASYAYMDVDEYSEYDNPFTTTVVDVSRFYNVSTPENSGSVFLDYDPNPGDSGLFFHTDYAFAEGHYWTTPGASNIAGFGPNFVRPESDMENWSARLGYRIAAGDAGLLQVALWGKNLTDDSSIVYGFDGCASGGGHCAFRAAPRTYGVEFTIEY